MATRTDSPFTTEPQVLRPTWVKPDTRDRSSINGQKSLLPATFTVTVSPQDTCTVGRTGGGSDGACVKPLHTTVNAMSPAALLKCHVVLIAITSPGAVAIVTSSLYPSSPHCVEIPSLSSYLRCRQGAGTGPQCW